MLDTVSPLAATLRRAVAGDVLFSPGDRARYATDASIYEMLPVGVVAPRSAEDVIATLAVARDEGISVTARGGGTSQAGQTVGAGLIVDFSRHMNGIVALDLAAMTAVVEPGVVLDELNRALQPHGLWFPVDVSTASRATIGGMAGNNSAGTRSLRYGIMRDRVMSIDAVLPGGRVARFGHRQGPSGLVGALTALAREHGAAIDGGFPQVSRRVGGYNIDALRRSQPNYATLLVGSEGTLALSTRITLKLAPLPGPTVLGICHFPRFRDAMVAAEAIVALQPTAVEVVDRTLIDLARRIAVFQPTMDRMVAGEPDALLIVEFAQGPDENRRRLQALADTMSGLGHPDAVIEATDPAFQRAIWSVRSAGLNIMMSMKQDGKPVSFIEDCAVPLAHLADYTERLTALFAAHGTTGTWYAHASVGCLHVRPVLNLKLERDVKAMRAIAEAAMALVQEYKGSHSGEHGDGIVRSEFHERMYGRELIAVFGAVKAEFDPGLTLNPGKIVDPPRMDDRRLFRYGPSYTPMPTRPALDWRGYAAAGSGLHGAVEMCNNNGACRALKGGVMCPSYRATRDERDTTRGRANTLRFALTGRLGAAGLASEPVADAMRLCVSCKACRRECPTGVDMARLKIETLHARNVATGVPLFDRAVAHLPDYAPIAARLGGVLALRERLPWAARAGERLVGFSARRPLPRWRRPYRQHAATGPETGTPVILFADCFNRAFEPETPAAAERVLAQAGARVLALAPRGGGRPVCCGRTFLAAGMVDRARREMERFVAALETLPVDAPIVGLEPSCLLTLRDEFGALLPAETAERIAPRAQLIAETLTHLGYIPAKAGGTAIYLHGHCHQKAFGAFSATEHMMQATGRDVHTIESSCCGMAGSFGYKAETYDVSVAMAELDLLPAVRRASAEAAIVADGFSCRHQIADLAGRTARHSVHLLDTGGAPAS